MYMAKILITKVIEGLFLDCNLFVLHDSSMKYGPLFRIEFMTGENRCRAKLESKIKPQLGRGLWCLEFSLCSG